jgi:hypothetical protein
MILTVVISIASKLSEWVAWLFIHKYITHEKYMGIVNWIWVKADKIVSKTSFKKTEGK